MKPLRRLAKRTMTLAAVHDPVIRHLRGLPYEHVPPVTPDPALQPLLDLELELPDVPDAGDWRCLNELNEETNDGHGSR